jgi:hypothetical protein
MLKKAFPHSYPFSAKESVLSATDIFDNTKGATVLIEVIQAERNASSADR